MCNFNSGLVSCNVELKNCSNLPFFFISIQQLEAFFSILAKLDIAKEIFLQSANCNSFLFARFQNPESHSFFKKKPLKMSAF